MCGIVGIIHLNDRLASLHDLSPMQKILRHRGPDDSGICCRGPIGIGMTRLAIIDVAGGQQPIYNEDQTLALVCNGEIYNHQALRAELLRRGHSFSTKSDVEVLLHLYEETGERCFERLNGMFGVAIADFRSGTIVLARDPFGQKPLYLWTAPGRVLFASELKALAAQPDFPRELSDKALASYLQFRYVPAPLTIFEAARKLPPGTSCTIARDGSLSLRRYFQMDLGPGVTDAVGDPDGSLTRDQLMGSVERHLMSERPLGVFLSGGLDSSAVVASMHLLGHRDIRTYTVGFEGFLDNEFETARRVASHFKTAHRETLLNADAYWDSLEEVVYHADEPLADLTTVPLFHLSKQASNDVVVVLSGEGADELLAGYPGMEQIRRAFDRQRRLRPAAPFARILRRLPWPPWVSRKLRLLSCPAADYLAASPMNMTEVFPGEFRNLHGGAPVREKNVLQPLSDFYADRPSWDGTSLVLGAYIEWWLPDDLLHKADRMTMAHSIELRCPFLDMEFAQFAARLRMDDRVRWGTQEPTRKISLKRAFLHQLPEGIALQRKKGFVIPVYSWLRDRYFERVRAELGRSSALGSSLFTRAVLDQLLQAARAGSSEAQHRVWCLLILNKWGDRWL